MKAEAATVATRKMAMASTGLLWARPITRLAIASSTPVRRSEAARMNMAPMVIGALLEKAESAPASSR